MAMTVMEQLNPDILSLAIDYLPMAEQWIVRRSSKHFCISVHYAWQGGVARQCRKEECSKFLKHFGLRLRGRYNRGFVHDPDAFCCELLASVHGALKHISEKVSWKKHEGLCPAIATQRKLARAFVRKFPEALQLLSDELRNDFGVCQVAFLADPKALEFAGDAIKRNPDAVLIVVSIDGRSLRFASDEVKDNPIVARVAIARTPLAATYASIKARRAIAPRKVTNAVMRSVFICGGVIAFAAAALLYYVYR